MVFGFAGMIDFHRWVAALPDDHPLFRSTSGSAKIGISNVALGVTTVTVTASVSALSPVAGGPAEAMGLTMRGLNSVGMHPDGRRLLFGASDATPKEVWALENFLPKPAR